MKNLTQSLCVIDDDDLYKLLLKKTIERFPEQIPLTCYANGEEAIKFLVLNKALPGNLPDVIFLDINMPVMDGWEFMENFLAIKNEFAKPISIFIASSSIATQDKEKAKEYKEISGYLEKPIKKNTIIEILSQ